MMQLQPLWRGLAAAMAMALVLSACAARQAAGTGPRDTPVTQGVYKVGQPYQILGAWYYPEENWDYDETGIASWYGAKFHGKPTANGETYNMYALTAAHPTLPMPTNVRVTNLENGRSLILRLNDRGPFKRGRIIDVSMRAAELLGFKEQGTAKVRVEMLGRAPLNVFAMGEPAAPQPVSAPAVAVPVTDIASTPLRAPGSSGTTGTQEDRQRVAHQPVPAASRIYVQAGAFRLRENAERMRDSILHLARGNERVALAETTVDGQTFYRVRIGPLETVEQADATLNSLINQGHQGARIIVD
jgi:rare lipoprotein A